MYKTKEGRQAVMINLVVSEALEDARVLEVDEQLNAYVFYSFCN